MVDYLNLIWASVLLVFFLFLLLYMGNSMTRYDGHFQVPIVAFYIIISVVESKVNGLGFIVRGHIKIVVFIGLLLIMEWSLLGFTT